MAQTPNTNPNADLVGRCFQSDTSKSTLFLVEEADTAREMGLDRETFGAGLPAGDTVVLVLRTNLPFTLKCELVERRVTPSGRDEVLTVCPLDSDPTQGFTMRRRLFR